MKMEISKSGISYFVTFHRFTGSDPLGFVRIIQSFPGATRGGQSYNHSPVTVSNFHVSFLLFRMQRPT